MTICSATAYSFNYQQQIRLYSRDTGMMIVYNGLDDPMMPGIISLSFRNISDGRVWIGSIPRELLHLPEKTSRFGDYFTVSEIMELYRRCFFLSGISDIGKDVSLLVRSSKSLWEAVIHPFPNPRPLKKILIDRGERYVYMIERNDSVSSHWLITMTFSEFCFISELVDFFRKRKEGPSCRKTITGGCTSAKISGHLSSTDRSKKAAKKDSMRSS